MDFFIRANEPFGLIADGEYKGRVKSAIKISEVFKPVFVELLSERGNAPISFLVPVMDALNSCNGIKAYKIKRGTFLDVRFLPVYNKQFELLCQKKFEDCLVTIYEDGVVRVVCENERSAEISEIPVTIKNLNIEKKDENIFVYSNKPPYFISVFSVGKRIKKIMENVFDEITFSPVFRTKTRLFDLEETIVEAEWFFDADGAKTKEKRVTRGIPFFKYEESFIGRIFFNRVLRGEPVSDMLTGELKEKEKFLKDFLGDAVCVLPCYCSDGVCLAYGEKDLYKTAEFYVEMKNGLINNVIEM